MQGHRNSGAIHEHFTDIHDRKPQVTELIQNTTIIHRETANNRLKIAEAVSIELQRPTLNIQTQFDLVLPSSRRRGGVPRTTEGQVRAQPTLALQQALPGEAPVHPTWDEDPALSQTQENTVRGGGRRALRNLPLRDYRE